MLANNILKCGKIPTSILRKKVWWKAGQWGVKLFGQRLSPLDLPGTAGAIVAKAGKLGQ